MTISRRELLGRLGGALGVGYAATLGLPSRARGAVRVASRPQRSPVAPIIRTLLGDLPPDQIPAGAILFHEHLSFKYPHGATSHVTDDVDLIIAEVRAAMGEGIAAIVDGGHPDMERNLGNLRRIAVETGMPIVASGGYYMQSYYPAELTALSAEQLADQLVEEAARDGLGAFGEIGQEGGVLTADERKVFQAVGMASARTGLPVFTHNAYSIRATDVPRDTALRQLDILEAAGADLGSVCIGHVCCLDDPNAEIAGEIAHRGAFVGWDRVTLTATMPDANRVRMAMALIDAGHADKLLLSSDFYSGRTLKSNGGPGIAQPKTVFGPMLLEAGLAEGALRRVLDDNPRRFLSFEPRVSPRS